jgi:hypothetical protein
MIPVAAASGVGRMPVLLPGVLSHVIGDAFVAGGAVP